MEADKNTTYQLGILGGGQLARMLLIKAHELGVSACVYSEHADDPAAQVTSQWFQGLVSDKTALEDFLQRCEIITFESEFFDAELLKGFGEATEQKFAPSLNNLEALQNRWSQKQLFEKFHLETAAFAQFDAHVTFESWCSKLQCGSVVIKKCFGGYDGYGTYVVRNENQYNQFLEQSYDTSIDYIVEAFIPFQRELAMTFARSQQGDVVHFPLVESFQQDSRCLWVKGPISHKKIVSFCKSVESFLNRVDYVGVIAFELFETAASQLLVNETAPRVHNSSHYSLNGFNVDQFSAHVKAVLGRKLNTPKSGWGGFAMYNLLGSGEANVALDTKLDVQIHWYGKNSNKPGRKMGHMNTQGINPESALERLKMARKEMKV